MAGSKINDVDHGYAKLLELVGKTDEVLITLGLHSDVDGEVMAKGEAHEFGTDTVPQRSFIAAWADENRERAVRECRDALAAALKVGQDPRIALERMALKFAGEIQQRMAAGIPPPSLVDGRTIHLIDTGELRSSIMGKVG